MTIILSGLSANAGSFNSTSLSSFNSAVTKNGSFTKLEAGLDSLWTEYESFTQQRNNNSAAFTPTNSIIPYSQDYVTLDAVASGDTQTLLNDLQSLGLQNGATFGRYVSGRVPVSNIGSMAQLSSLQLARPVYAMTDVGATTSQGDQAMRADIARSTFGVTGSGVTVGVLSNSYNNLGGANDDIASGDLPQNVQVLKDLAGGGNDQGRAMMQLVHDVAPGANLAFHTASLGQANFAQGILDLANVAGAKVIVDGAINLAEPMFQDGIIAQAVDQVVAQGSSYFSAAGNSDRQSYESGFNPSGIILQGVGEFHDFDPTEGVDRFQRFTIPQGEQLLLSFQWDSPFGSLSSSGAGSPNDLDIFLLNSTNNQTVASSRAFNITNGDPLEAFRFVNDGSFGTDQFELAIANFAGPNPGLMKYINFGSATPNEYDTNSSTLFGHANAQGAEAVGAAAYFNTPEFGQNPPLLNDFSSSGGTPILFDTAGNRLASPEIREKPEIVATDGTNTTFLGQDIPQDADSFPNFFGTPAAAAHAAAVAALMLEAAPGARPNTIYSILENTAIDMRTPGFDFDSGYGLIQADRAVAAAAAIPEPSSSLGILAFGAALGIGGMRKKRQTKQQKSLVA